jgi:hypothetical protein
MGGVGWESAEGSYRVGVLFAVLLEKFPEAEAPGSTPGVTCPKGEGR